MPAQLFVTGMPRSGTTLIDKLLSIHPQAHVFSQPLPLLYVRVKEAFLESRPGTGDHRYPLNDMFGANWYPPADFSEFLARFQLGVAFCRTALEDMVPFDGQYTKPEDPFRVLDAYRPASLYGFITRYFESLGVTGGLHVVGSKETWCEEYIPYYLASGARVLMILRDPRDAITSLNHGRGRSFGGRRKPHLFNLRQWRKSVAFALAQEGRPDFLVLRYEDLVRDPRPVAARITDFLALDRFASEVFESDLRSQSGRVWRSNSSHRAATRITPDSVGRYREHLPRETDRFVQAACFAEMKRLGYEVEIADGDVLSILDRHREDGALERPELASYAWSGKRREEERTRWQMLRAGVFEPAWFIFETAHAQLCRRWRRGGGG